MELQFDAIDKKLISYLYHNYREPLTTVAKACRISRDQAEYRLKKLESSGILKKYATIFNYPALGFEEFIVVWLRLNCTNEQKKSLRKELRKNKKILTYFDILGDFHLGFDCVYKNKSEFAKEFGEFLNNHKNIIQSYSTFLTISFDFFPLKEFDIKQTEKEFAMKDSINIPKIDNKDMKILKELEKNGRTKIIDIAKATNLSAENCLYKLKNLYKNKIILGSRIDFDMEKM
nr:Lrp/AsnC family transcriptional regulator [Nanoarchaeota archaeon]